MIVAEAKVVAYQLEDAPDFDLQEQELIRFVEALKKDDHLHSKLFVRRLEKFLKLR
jgi:hypothetical protein